MVRSPGDIKNKIEKINHYSNMYIFCLPFPPVFADSGTLTHLCLASHKWDIGKQCRPRPDAAEPGV